MTQWRIVVALGASVLVGCGEKEDEGRIEAHCSDVVDNDSDGLLDCDDDGCSASRVCNLTIPANDRELTSLTEEERVGLCESHLRVPENGYREVDCGGLLYVFEGYAIPECVEALGRAVDCSTTVGEWMTCFAIPSDADICDVLGRPSECELVGECYP